MRHFEICNWARYQHYKDRDPTWLKLHRSLLSDYQWAKLPDVSKGQLMGLWLVAARCGNKIPADPVWLGHQIGATEPIDLEPLLAGGWGKWCSEASDALRVPTGEQYPGSSNMVQDDTEGSDPVLALARSREKRREEKRREDKKRGQAGADHARGSDQPPTFPSFTDEQRAGVEALQRLAASRRAEQ